jgi:flagellar motor switch/type III secretory pathway protein FliN
MPHSHVQDVLVSSLKAALGQAGAELAASLGSSVETDVTFLARASPEEWAAHLGGPSLLVSGSVGGGAEGPVVFILRREAVVRLAARSSGGGGADEKGDRYDFPERPGGCFAEIVPVPFSLTEADTAAAVFTLARIGAAATGAWEEAKGAAVRWPSEAGELTATLADLAAGLGPLPAAVAEATELAGLKLHLGGPLAIDLRLLLPRELAEALARRIDPAANWSGGEGLLSALRPEERGLARLLPVVVPVRVVVASRSVSLREILELVPGRVLDLQRPCDRPLELFAGSRLVASGDVVQVGAKLGLHVRQLPHSDAAPKNSQAPAV